MSLRRITNNPATEKFADKYNIPKLKFLIFQDQVFLL